MYLGMIKAENVTDAFDIALLFENEEFVAVAKPAGLETVSETGAADVAALGKQKFGYPILLPVHRLDRDTTGAVLFAKTRAAEEKLTAAFRQRTIIKEYRGICLGVPANRQGTINRGLSQWQGGRRPVQVVKGGGLPARTDYWLLAKSLPLEDQRKLSYLRFRPHQGRTHQIRVHAGAFGYPLLGDDQYGDRKSNKWAKQRFGLARQALHAYRLQLLWREETISIVCPLPDDMAKIVAEVLPQINGDG